MKNILLIPLAFLVTLALLFQACGGDDTPEEELTLLSTCKYSIELDGQKLEREEIFDLTGISCNVVTSGAGTGRGYGASLRSNDSDEILSFFRGTIYNLQFGEKPTLSQFDSLFFIGNYNYTDDAADGIQISYESPNGEKWRTDLGGGDQSDSSFELLDKVSETVSETPVIIARIKFDCKLYNETGDQMTCEGTATIQLNGI